MNEQLLQKILDAENWDKHDRAEKRYSYNDVLDIIERYFELKTIKNHDNSTEPT